MTGTTQVRLLGGRPLDARFAVVTLWSRLPAGVVWLLRWTIRGLCCDLVSGALAQEVLMRGECCTSAGPLVSSVLSLTVNNLT